MPNKFIECYDQLNLLSTAEPFLRRAQLGALWAIASHFTVSSENAIISLPTGSGKTLVATLIPYLLQSRRILVVTPNRILRNQVYLDFKSLKLAKDLGVLPKQTTKLSVKIITKQIKDIDQWNRLRDYDVIVATPHVVSPAYEAIPDPPEDLFDLLIVDEAHHAPAKTWRKLLSSFPLSNRILLTATPYRRDRKEIPGELIYDYPIAQAVAEGIYDPISYVPARPIEGDRDRGLIHEAKNLLQQERKANLHGALLIRTDRISEGERLQGLYQEAGLLVGMVHSQKLRNSQDAIKKLQDGELDGLVCIDMLGEGFDIPRLKIAVLHSPHRSLPSTLQFVGRVARAGIQDVGPARVVAIPTSDPTAKTPESDLLRLFQEDANWQKLIPDLAKGALESESSLKKFFSAFSYDGIETLSARSLRPQFKSVIFDVEGLEISFDKSLSLSQSGEIIFNAIENDLNFQVWITAKTGSPSWLETDEIIITDVALHLAYFNAFNSTLFIQSDSQYHVEEIREVLCPLAQRISPNKLDSLLRNEDVTDVFNIGISNIAPKAARRAEYTIYAGKQADGAIRPNEVRRSSLGHASARIILDEPAASEVRGASMRSASVWSSRSGNLLDFIQWCDEISTLIRGSSPSLGYISPVGILSYGTTSPIEEAIPLAISWPSNAYISPEPLLLVHNIREEEQWELLDLDIEAKKDPDNPYLQIFVNTQDRQFCIANYNCYSEKRSFTQSKDSVLSEWLVRSPSGWAPVTHYLVDYFNLYPPKIWLSSGDVIEGERSYRLITTEFNLPQDLWIPWNWEGTEITMELGRPPGDALNVHEATVRKIIESWGDHCLVLSDHAKGEISDLIAISKVQVHDTERRIGLFHCKGARGAPSLREGDITIVASQAIKSNEWIGHDNFFRECNRRYDRGRLIIEHGQEEELRMLLNLRHRSFQFQVYIVQPGLSMQSATSAGNDPRLSILASCYEWFQDSGVDFRVICSD